LRGDDESVLDLKRADAAPESPDLSERYVCVEALCVLELQLCFDKFFSRAEWRCVQVGPNREHPYCTCERKQPKLTEEALPKPESSPNCHGKPRELPTASG